ncbi:MAG: hypothetical protein ABI045_04585 [Flavobacteriales bacterium]
MSRWGEKCLNKSKIDSTLAPFLVTVINLGLKILLFISIAGVIGIQTTSFAIILVSISLAIDNAFNKSLGRLASGIILLIFKSFKVGGFNRDQWSDVHS